MTMRSAAFTSGKTNKPDADAAEQGRKQTPEPLSVLKKESVKIRAPAVLCNIHNSSRQHLNSKAKSSLSASVRPLGQSPVARKGQEENWVTPGALTLPLAKQMGAEGTPGKSKSLFGGQTSQNHLGKMDPVASNGGSKQPRKQGPGPVQGQGQLGQTGGPSPEHGADGKRRNTMRGAGHPAAQTSCIRQILLLQLELIEQQQQQLQNKNKEIDDLKAEKEMLMARIERMERRLQVVKKDRAETRPMPTPRRKESTEPTSSESPSQCEGQSQTPRPTHFARSGKGIKRRFLFQESRMARSRRGQPKTPPPKESQALTEKPQEEAGPDLRSHVPAVAESEELPYMTTTDMYLSCWHRPPASPWRDPSPVQEDTVAVPSWRESVIEPLEDKKAADIPESLDDSVFLKRHSKLELDEKRRKRWDIQRIREQRMFQRLQQRMNRRKVIQESEPELLSFYPDTEDVESIMITPFLPVVAFGRPLPNLKQQNFYIPWLDERSHCRQEVSKKKTPHRTCRK